MLRFASGSVRAVNARRAVQETLELAYGSTSPGPGVILINATVGHDLVALSEAVRTEIPGALVLAASCAGTVGREGPGESTYDVALMGIDGDGWVVSRADGLSGETSFARGVKLARGLLGTPHPVTMVYLVASGIDIANDRILAGMESILGPDVTIFGATSSDQMKGIATYQAIDGVLGQHAAFAVGFWDPTLSVDTQASHGFVATGEPLIVTAARGNRIVELNGRTAWPMYLETLGLPPDATEADTIPIGALAERLSDVLAAEYGNPDILRVVTHHTDAGEIIYATEIAPGTRLHLTVRDEDRIFSDMDRLLRAMTARRDGRVPVAVFQADCLARGRRLLGRVMKDELVQRIQHPFKADGVTPPWLGMYGFGEYEIGRAHV